MNSDEPQPKEVSHPNEEKIKRHIELSWKILECKYIYYDLDGMHPLALPDAIYDQMQREYDGLCKELGLEPTATNMVGFGDTPSCRLVRQKLDDYRK